MLNRLQLFRNIGQFDNVAAGAAVPLTRLTVTYAENGRGKTTLAAIMRSLSNGSALDIAERQRLGSAQQPHVVIDCAGGPPHAIFQDGQWNRTLPNLVVFDDAFVDGNVHSGLAVGTDHRQNLHEWILGARGVALSRELKNVVTEIENINRDLRAAADAIPAQVRAHFTVDAFCALEQREDIAAAIVEAERILAAARDQGQIAAAAEFAPFALPEIDIAALEALLARGLPELDADAARMVSAHTATLGAQGEAWVAQGVRLLPDGDLANAPCPFCQQELGGSPLVNHYRAYFSAAYNNHKAAIATATRNFQQTHAGDAPRLFERAIGTAAESRAFWRGFTDVNAELPDREGINATWVQARDAMLQLLERKQAAPLEAIAVPAEVRTILARFGESRAAVGQSSDAFQTINTAIRIVKERAAAGNIAVLERDLAALRAQRDRFLPDIVDACARHVALQTSKREAEGRRDAARVALDDYRTATFPAYEQATNDYLARFNAGFRLERIQSQNVRGGSTCTYNVLVNNRAVAVTAEAEGAPSFRTILSAGDRNTLALAFFFASLEHDQALADKIVVIDDPVSSLDDHRSMTTVQEIRRLMGRVAQVVVLSHSKPFLMSVWEGTDPTLRSAIEVARDGAGSTLRVWNVNQDIVTEHDRRHALVRDFIGGTAVNNREVAQGLRPMLEAYLRVASPEFFRPGTLLGPFIGLCEQRVGTPNELLSRANIDELRALTEYANRFHHDTNPTWQTQHINDAELLNFARRTLTFIQP